MTPHNNHHTMVPVAPGTRSRGEPPVSIGTSADLDRNGVTPLYQQISALIRQAIGRGDLVAGSRIQNEVELAAELEVSRPTVRRAIAELVSTGVIVRRRGIGTSVAHHQVPLTFDDRDVCEALSAQGFCPEFTVLDARILRAEPAICDRLALPEGAAILRLRRLLLIDSATIGLIDGYVSPLAVSVNDEALGSTGLRTLVDERLAPTQRVSHVLEAITAEPVHARLLDRPAGAALLRVRTTGFDTDHSPLYWAEQLYRADLTRVEYGATTAA